MEPLNSIESFFEEMESLLGNLTGAERKARASQIIYYAASWGGDSAFESIGIMQATLMDLYKRKQNKLFKKIRRKNKPGNCDLKNTCKN